MCRESRWEAQYKVDVHEKRHAIIAYVSPACGNGFSGCEEQCIMTFKHPENRPAMAKQCRSAGFVCS